MWPLRSLTASWICIFQLKDKYFKFQWDTTCCSSQIFLNLSECLIQIHLKYLRMTQLSELFSTFLLKTVIGLYLWDTLYHFPCLFILLLHLPVTSSSPSSISNSFHLVSFWHHPWIVFGCVTIVLYTYIFKCFLYSI